MSHCDFFFVFFFALNAFVYISKLKITVIEHIIFDVGNKKNIKYLLFEIQIIR